MEMKVVDERGTKLVQIPCTRCGHPVDWDRGSLLSVRDGSRQLCCVSCFGLPDAEASLEDFDRALALLDETEGQKKAPRGWRFRARLEDIDIARVCREAEEAGLECIEVGCPRSPDIGTRVLITQRLFNELIECPHTEDVWRGSVKCRLDRQHPWDWPDGCRYDLTVPKWDVLLEHGKPVTATRAAELLHAMRTLRDERLRCVVRAVGVNERTS